MSLEAQINTLARSLKEHSQVVVLSAAQLPGDGVELLCRLPTASRWNLLAYHLLTCFHNNKEGLIRIHRTLVLRDGGLREGGAIQVWARNLPSFLEEVVAAIPGAPVPQAERVVVMKNPFDGFYKPTHVGGGGGYALGQKPEPVQITSLQSTDQGA